MPPTPPDPPGDRDVDPSVETLLGLLVRQAQQHALVLMDPHGRIVGWLAGAANVFGYDADEILGRHSRELFVPEDAQRGLAEHELRVAAEVGKADDDRWMLRQDGTRIWVTGNVSALRDERGGLVGFGKVMRDVTDLKARIDAVEGRVRALTEAQAQRTVFLQTLAHELGNTFASLRMMLETTLRQVTGPPDLVARLTTMSRQVALTETLLGDLQSVTTVEQGRSPLRRGPVGLGEILRTATEACRPQAEARGQRLRLLLPPSELTIDGDASRLHEVFVNLLVNASKYTPDGGRIWVKATSEGGEAVVKVEDTGVGIGPELLPRIFELFTRAATPDERSPSGLGLGLWLVKNLVALHGGTVGARSEGAGRGSEFSVRLPLRDGASGASPSETDEIQ